MKKIKLGIILSLVFLMIATYVNAYSTSEYSIDVPETYVQTAEGVFSKINGDNINISVNKITGKMEYPYTEKNLNDLAKELEKQINNNKDFVMTTMENKMDQYGAEVSEEELKTIVNSMNINSIDKKEITNVSKNNYKCFKISANCEVIGVNAYIDQYYIFSGNNLFIITNTMGDKENLDSDEIKAILDSFTITNYKEPVKDSIVSNRTVMAIIVGGVVGGIVGAISSVINKSKKKNKDVDIDLNNDNK